MDPDLCAVILAGGESIRMGSNKALLEVGGRFLIRRVLDSVRSLAGLIVVSANDSASYEFLGLPVVADILKGHGPLAGLHAVMTRFPAALYLLLACDMPNLSEALLRRLLVAADGFDAVVPRTPDGGKHPLCAVYRRSCLPVIETKLHAGVNKVTDIVVSPPLRVRWLEDVTEWDVVNLNSPGDLSEYRSRR